MKMNEPAPGGRAPLAALEQRDEFGGRHIGPSAGEQAHMLQVLGYASRAAMVDALIPAAIRRAAAMDLPPPCTEAAALAELRALAVQNKVLKSFIGQGYYGTHTPGVILRNILENPAWYTAYTPYQPEIAQGRLEALVNFQTMVCDLTGMPIANASMLDEATAAAEAMTLARRVAKNPSNVFIVAGDCHPQTIEVVQTRARPLGIEVVVGFAPKLIEEREFFGVLAQYPSTAGLIHDLRPLVAAIHAKNALLCVASDLLALTLLAPPGEWGADVVVGSSQRFGVPMGYGGPHAAFFATRDEFKRTMPGRLVGATVDADGGHAYRLALQTREQHIRREKATSNICTAQVLLAVIAAMYAVYHGPEGLTRIARRVHRLTAILKDGLGRLGHEVMTPHFFDTLLVNTGPRTAEILDHGVQHNLNFRRVSDGRIGIALDETTAREDVALIWHCFHGADAPFSVEALDAAAADGIPPALARGSAFLTHPVFNRCQSEHEMLRYLRRLADKDLALDRSMIPLGSCTMKLNATSEMIPVTWPEFGNMHPFAPADQAAGYREMIAQLERMLVQATGYAAVSLQPNAGSQGEYAGLLIIRAYHEARGEGHRNVCLIPSSAHGTNPASAHMAGMQVVVVACDDQGNIDLGDLKAKAALHAANLAAIMVTYPSTHGVFEAGIRELCDIVHAHGGQVYVDGANMNAMVGLCAPGQFGADVSHLNLHKTFCIPHGGGGPGVGPVAVGAHLARFLPGHRSLPDGEGGGERIGAVAAAPYGSASILPISWMYMRMMGAEGLTAATEAAILAANYVARRLRPHYPVLYSGVDGLVAHECILDLRPLKAASGIEVDDVAKRLMDFGFHSPTMSFPVPGTLMVEPTESESQAELDRFIAAMIAIREEIRMIEDGTLDRADNPLKHAPHTAAAVTADTWPHAYTRERAAYPLPSLRHNKYWPPVARADNVYGDRNLFCSCLPVAEYE
ncbi:MAG: aminomethyl-transferring glycine dehydrogenase [Betaproteobacteria bacterium]|nr:aminomethyl-transferring glycine dehydrogenase [Betaproteobacteria bacterium]